MERDLVMPSWMMREVAAYGAMESSPPSRSSSGCQSGWTLYLDHSNGTKRYLPCDPAAAHQRWKVLQVDEDDVEDSMASDASSGPRLHDDQDEETRLEPEGKDSIGRHSYSSSVHRSASSGSAGPGCFGSSTWSRSSQGPVKGHIVRRGVVINGGEEATALKYREICVDIEDELDDTASSSAVFSCPVAMLHHRSSHNKLCNR